MALCEQYKLEHTSSCMIGSDTQQWTSCQHYPLSYADQPHKCLCCSIDSQEKKSLTCGKRWSPRLSGCLLFQNVREEELRSRVLLRHVFLCQACRGSSCVLAAPVMLLLLAVTCGSMWGSCRSTQRRRQERDLLSPQLLRPAVVVLWRRVGEAVSPPTPCPFHVQSLTDFLPSFFTSGAKHAPQLWKQHSLPVYSALNCHILVGKCMN